MINYLDKDGVSKLSSLIADDINTVNNSIDNTKSQVNSVENRVTELEGKSVPVINYGTNDLIAGESELASGTFYFVYE